MHLPRPERISGRVGHWPATGPTEVVLHFQFTRKCFASTALESQISITLNVTSPLGDMVRRLGQLSIDQHEAPRDRFEAEEPTAPGIL